MKKKLLILLLFFHLFILSRLQFTAWPEMISFPYLINHGFVTYKDMVHAYPPLLINTLAILYKIFGYNISALKIFTWSTFIINDILIFYIIQKITKKNNLALIGICVYIILHPILEGNMIWPDLFIIPFLLLTFLFLVNKKYFLSGIMLGLGLLTKQTVIFYIFFSTIFILVCDNKRIKNILKLTSGILMISLPFLISLITQNSFLEFLNWTIIYPSKYWTKFPGYVQLTPTLRENLILSVLFLPLSYLFFTAKKKIFQDNIFLLLFAFLIAAIIGVYPRFSFFHFQSGLAFLIIVYLYLFNQIKLKPIYLLTIPFIILLINFKNLQSSGNRFWEQSDLILAQTIKNNSLPEKPIYLLGLPSQLYVFSNHIPNKPWIDNFGWYLEIPEVQEDVIKGFEKDPPSVIFWRTPDEGNWFDLGAYQPKLITNWIEKNYTRDKEIKKGVWEWTKK